MPVLAGGLLVIAISGGYRPVITVPMIFTVGTRRKR